MPHCSLVNLLEWHRKTLPTREGQRVLQFAALSFDVAFQEILSTLCDGATLVLLDECIRRDPRALCEFLRTRSIQRLFVPPIVLQGLAEYCKTSGVSPKSLEEVITAGEQLRITPEISHLFDTLETCRLHNHYGPTETHVVTTLTLPANTAEWTDLPAIGRPIANTQIYLLDRQRQPVPIGVVGEIYIAGAGVARGYLNRPEMTSERFVTDPFSADPQARMYQTGDLGRWWSDGNIEYVGRNDHQVKIRGFRIELGEIESQLMRHAKVREAVVVARDESVGGKCLVAYVIPNDAGVAEGTPRAEELRAHLKTVVPEHMVPSAFVTLSHLPITHTGKLDRQALPAPELGAYASRPYEAPQGEVEEILAGIWRELLRLEHVGRHDNFFELGGHSLFGMRLIGKVSERFSVHLPVTASFRYPTVHQMARVVETLRSIQGDPGDLKGVEFEETAL
jgi:acyl-coenzyme A synthetase/AMP-(fatty) acid ligase